MIDAWGMGMTNFQICIWWNYLISFSHNGGVRIATVIILAQQLLLYIGAEFGELIFTGFKYRNEMIERVPSQQPYGYSSRSGAGIC